MNDEQIRRLLVAAMAYDNRKMPGEANVLAWSEAARRGRWSFEAALDAIHAHYAESTDFLMPGHVTARIRKARQLPVAVERRMLEAPPAQPETIRSIISTLSKMLGWQKAPAAAESLPVQCPYCHSLPGKPCVRVIGHGHRRGQHVPIQNPHQSRVDLVKGINE